MAMVSIFSIVLPYTTSNGFHIWVQQFISLLLIVIVVMSFEPNYA